VVAGKPTEIEALNGRLARWGAELGVATPVNALLAELIRAREAQARG
jgi:2-dehydropantoate 2-reductase